MRTGPHNKKTGRSPKDYPPPFRIGLPEMFQEFPLRRAGYPPLSRTGHHCPGHLAAGRTDIPDFRDPDETALLHDPPEDRTTGNRGRKQVLLKESGRDQDIEESGKNLNPTALIETGRAAESLTKFPLFCATVQEALGNTFFFGTK